MLTKKFELEFRKDGSIHDDAQLEKILDGLSGLTDLAILSHGWNNDVAEARELYDELGTNLKKVSDEKIVSGLQNRKLGVVRIYWPSKKFADGALTPGGGAADAARESEQPLVALLDELERDPSRLGGKDRDVDRVPHLERAKKLASHLDDAATQREFVQCLRAVLNPEDKHDDDGSSAFFSRDPEELFRELSEPVSMALVGGVGGAADLENGGAAGVVGDFFRGVRSAARRLLNFATYYQMKSRAGTVGRVGAALMLAQVRSARPDLPLHLVGHSFGARLLTAAASTLRPGSQAVSLSLLQAAFSHNGFADNFDGKHDGAFRSVLADKRVSGPILITHTKNDRAVGLAYPLASRISRDRAAALGDQNDPYGGLGRNGAQHTPEAAGHGGALLALNGKYKFARHRVFNLRADQFIKGHGDVRGPQVAYALLNNIAVSG